jgi:HAD-hyrolase-like
MVRRCDVSSRLSRGIQLHTSALYIGDSLVKDIYMANRAGVHSAWARYGTHYDRALWQQLMSHRAEWLNGQQHVEAIKRLSEPGLTFQLTKILFESLCHFERVNTGNVSGVLQLHDFSQVTLAFLPCESIREEE